MKWRLGLEALAAVVSIAIVGWWSLRQTNPSVTDLADLLSKDQRARIAAHHARLLENFDIDYRVVTAKGVSDVDQFTESLFDKERIGKLSSRSRGSPVSH